MSLSIVAACLIYVSAEYTEEYLLEEQVGLISELLFPYLFIKRTLNCISKISI